MAGDERVMTISVHEAGRWPHTGLAEDRGGGNARNLPVPPGYNDSEARYLLHNAMLPLIERYRPQADHAAMRCRCAGGRPPRPPLALQQRLLGGRGGASRRSRPASSCSAAAAITPIRSRAAGPASGARSEWLRRSRLACRRKRRQFCARLVYNRAAGRNPPEHWFTTLRDAPREGPVRDEIRALARQTLTENADDAPSPPYPRPCLRRFPRRSGAAGDGPGTTISPRPSRTLPKQHSRSSSDGGKTHQFQVEMAMTPQQQEVGLMFRHGVRVR